MLLASMAEVFKIEWAIIFCEKVGSSIVATLDDVEWNCGKLDAGTSWHI